MASDVSRNDAHTVISAYLIAIPPQKRKNDIKKLCGKHERQYSTPKTTQQNRQRVRQRTQKGVIQNGSAASGSKVQSATGGSDHKTVQKRSKIAYSE